MTTMPIARPLLKYGRPKREGKKAKREEQGRRFAKADLFVEDELFTYFLL